MALRITTKPQAPVLTVPEFRDHARLGGEKAEDEAIHGMIAAVTSWLAGPQGWLGRSLVSQELELTLPLDAAQGCSGIALPRPPVIQVANVAVIAADGTATLIAREGWTTHEAADGLTHLSFTAAFHVPVLAPGAAFLRVAYQAGYGVNGEDVDPGIRHAMLMAVMRLYAGRGDPTMTLQTDPMMMELFAPFRVWGQP